MADDPLAKWRRPGQEPVKAPAKETGSGAPPIKKTDDSYGYVAFKASDISAYDFVSVVRVSGLVRCLSYIGLVEVAHDGEFGTQIALVFNYGPIVFIYGRNLEPLVLGFLLRKIEFIREFNAGRWPEPKDKSEPFISKIEIMAKDTPQAMAQLEQLDSVEQ